MNESDNQINNTKPWLWKKGQSGNVLGRPKGKTMKEWAKDYLSRMSNEERDEFMEGIPKDIIWKMSEGAPQTNTDITSGGKPIPLFDNVTKTNGISDNNSNE
jgi:hypothetical protein